MSFSRSKTQNLETQHNIETNSEELIGLGRGEALSTTDLEPVHKTFESFASSCPTDIAFTSANRSYSYRELNEWSDKVAQNLLSGGANSVKRVGILMEPSALMVASALGILKCGAAYVPLDVAQPERRIAKVVVNAGLSSVLVDKKSVDKIKNIDCQAIMVEENFTNISLDGSISGLKTSSVSLDDPAYLIYTSGSTGEPKGVVIGHQALAHSTLARRMVYPGKSVFLLVSPISCDSSIAGIWGTLATGGHLVAASYEECRDPEALIRLINKYKVTKTLCIPSLYEGLLDVIEKLGSDIVRSLKAVIVAGETLHQSLVNRHFRLLGQTVELINEYGPTESTVWASYHTFTSPEPVSIGVPLPGTSLYLLNEDLKLTPRGEVGEIFIGSGQLAKGYFGNKQATEQAFLHDPFAGREDSRMYRTGDLACWSDDGRLKFIGRKDHQVKLRGYRVELGAIESVLRSFSHVREAAVVANESFTGLSAFIVCTEQISSKCLREMLEGELPSHMIPSKISIMDHLPLTSNGKVDRNALAQLKNNPKIPSIESEKVSDDYVEIAAKVSKAWGELLNLDTVPEDVNFFDLGGHSLMVFKLQQSLEKHTGFKPPIVSLFRHTTVSTQAEHILLQIDNSQKNNSSLEVAA